MNEENFIKNLRSFSVSEDRVEVINGVRIKHTGMLADSPYVNGKSYPIEYIEIYDEFGNALYHTYDTMEEAQKGIDSLKRKGEDAIIGPTAPDRDYEHDKLIPREAGFSVYIVRPKEVEEGIEP